MVLLFLQTPDINIFIYLCPSPLQFPEARCTLYTQATLTSDPRVPCGRRPLVGLGHGCWLSVAEVLVIPFPSLPALAILSVYHPSSVSKQCLKASFPCLKGNNMLLGKEVGLGIRVQDSLGPSVFRVNQGVSY